MAQLHGFDFFTSGHASVAIEPRAPQCAFPEHDHDFFEIVIVENGTGIHVFNGLPHTLSKGMVCFVRDHDRHLYEHTENLCLTNVLYRSPQAFQFISGLDKLLPQEEEGNYPSHWRVNQSVLQQARPLIDQMVQCNSDNIHSIASREVLFMQLLVLLRKTSLNECGTECGKDNDMQLSHLIMWLEDNFAADVNWEQLADTFSLSLRTLHRQMKQQTGLTPQRYLNRLRLIKARHLLRHSEGSVTDIAFDCGFGDSNHFSTLFKREFSWSPRDIRQGRDIQLQ